MRLRRYFSSTKNEKSLIYGTTSEFFKAYYATNKTILSEIPKYFVSSVCQFCAVTPSDLKNLLSKLSKFEPLKKNIGFYYDIKKYTRMMKILLVVSPQSTAHRGQKSKFIIFENTFTNMYLAFVDHPFFKANLIIFFLHF